MAAHTGLGKAIVKRFYEAGATVIALDVDEGALKELKGTFPNVIPISVDLLDWEGARNAVEAILPLHHLVNNAGIMSNEAFLNSSSQGIDR
jgi:NAD(P)-dependent dehydrogenase (short-subunit alcohol dehydrogenase family)